MRQGMRPGRGAWLRERTGPRVIVGALVVVGARHGRPGRGRVHVGFGAAPAAATTRTTAGGASKTVWLCAPGQADDPCTSNLASTTVAADGSTETVAASPATASKFDCFYVYPTVSEQTTANANLEVQPAETVSAENQASRFSPVCRVWAPMYRQRTDASLFKNQSRRQSGGVRQPAVGLEGLPGA